MKYRTFKAIREDLDEVKTIKNLDDFKAAVPLVVEATAKMADMRRLMRKIGELTEEVSEKCTAYALAHPTVFVNGLAKDGKGIEHGDVRIGDVLYHFAAGYKGFLRIDGNPLTQEFLDGLPKGWVKGKFEIDATEIKSLGVTEDDLHKAGLVRRANNVWSLPDPTDAAEGGE